MLPLQTRVYLTYFILNILWSSEYEHIWGSLSYICSLFCPNFLIFSLGRRFLRAENRRGGKQIDVKYLEDDFPPTRFYFLLSFEPEPRNRLSSPMRTRERGGIINKNFRSTRVYKECALLIHVPCHGQTVHRPERGKISPRGNKFDLGLIFRSLQRVLTKDGSSESFIIMHCLPNNTMIDLFRPF